MASQDVIAMTWGETADLAPTDGTPATRDRLYGVVAKFAAAADSSGRQDALRRAPAPRLSDPPAIVNDYNAMAVIANTPPAPATLPNRVALLETDQAGNGLISPNRAPSWATDTATTRAGIYQTRATPQRFFRLFESQGQPAAGEPGFMSEFTGTGMPPVPTTAVVRRWYRNPNWWVGLAGGFLFFLALFSILWTANSFSQAYDLLSGRQPEQFAAFAAKFPPNAVKFANEASLVGADNKPLTGDALKKVQDLRQTELGNRGADCLTRLREWGDAIQTPRTRAQQAEDLDCLRIMGEAVAFASTNLVLRHDNFLEEVLQRVGGWLYSWHVPGPLAPTVSLSTPIFLMMVATVVVLIALGRGVTGRPLGALISPEGRYSLALAQVTFWTIIILTSAGAIAVFNAGLVSEHMRDVDAKVASAISIFPSIPQEIWAVLGISFVSPVLANLIKGMKPEEGAQTAAVQPGGPASVTFLTSNTSGLVRNEAHRASIADWFLGEEGANKDKIDISRVQMVMVTAGLIVTYGSEIFAFTRDISPAAMVAAIAAPKAMFATLPPVGATMAGLLLMSHATYLVAKAADKK